MSKEEKLAKHEALYQHVTSHTSDFWAASFVKQLASTKIMPEQSTPTPYLDMKLFLNRYQSTDKRVLLFDYDVIVLETFT